MFKEKDRIQIENLSCDGHVIIDGNPFVRNKDEILCAELVKGVIRIVLVSKEKGVEYEG